MYFPSSILQNKGHVDMSDMLDLGTHTINIHTTHYRCCELECRAAICPDCAGCDACAIKYAQYKQPRITDGAKRRITHWK
jgi:hypothetical protein